MQVSTNRSFFIMLQQASSHLLSQRWKSALGFGVSGLLLLLSVQWPIAWGLVNVWIDNPAYQYAGLVIPMVVYLAGWHHRTAYLAVRPQADFSGVVVAAGAGLIWAASTLMNLAIGQQFAMVLALQAILMAAVGWRAYWSLFPTLVLLFWMLPCGDVMQPVLRLLTVKAIELFAILAHLPHAVDGYVVVIGSHRYIVLDECSGLSHFTLAAFLGCSFGALMYRSFHKVAALTVFGALIGILSNILRVNTIVLVDWLRGSQMDLSSHTRIQWLVLICLLSLMFWVVSRLEHESSPAQVPAMRPEPSGRVMKWMPVAAATTVLIIVGGVDWQTEQSKPLSRSTLEQVAVPDVSNWKLVSPASEVVIDESGQTAVKLVDYQHEKKRLRVQIVQTLSPQAKLADAWLDPGDRSAWRQLKLEKHPVCVKASCLDVLHATWRQLNSGRIVSVYFWYRLGDFTTLSQLALRARHGWSKLTGSSASPLLISLMTDGIDLSEKDLGAFYQQLNSALLSVSGAERQ